MFADLRIEAAAGTPYPLVPDEAIIADGNDSRVVEALGDGRYRPVRVRTGRSSGGMTEVLAGLHGGERIVTSGQFLIDSEASLSGILQRMDAGHQGTDKDETSPALPLPQEKGSNAMPGMNMPAPASKSNAGGDRP
jgi:Cu(I)/Ag(I) efflux system membrane fusion protein